MSEEINPILITGAAGYLGSWIVNYLLKSGHTVHGTVRDLNDEQKIKHLCSLKERYPNNLFLYEANLLENRSFDKAMENCAIVIHTASPYFLDKPKDIQKELIIPALNGTRNVIDSVNRTESVKRVVLTSSVATLYCDACDLNSRADHTVQESDINTNQNINHSPYAYSKTIAEQSAWEEQKKQSRWDLVTIHPGAIFGPSISERTDATSVKMIIQFLNGSFRTGVPKLWLGVVDVRDVAKAHIEAATRQTAKGRYIIVGNSFSLLEISKVIRINESGIKNRLPKSEAPNWLLWIIAPLIGLQRSYLTRNTGYPIKFNNERSKYDLELKYHDISDTLNDHMNQIIADRLI